MEKSSKRNLKNYIKNLQDQFKSNYIYLTIASQNDLQIISNFIKDDTNYIILFKNEFIMHIFKRKLEDLIEKFSFIRSLCPINNETLRPFIGSMIEMIVDIRISIYYFLCHEYSCNLKDSNEFYLELGCFERGLKSSFGVGIMNDLADYIKNFKKSEKFNYILVEFEKNMHSSAVKCFLDQFKLLKLNFGFDMIQVIAMLNLFIFTYNSQKLGLALMVDLINEYSQLKDEIFIINRDKLSQLVKVIWSSKSSLTNFLIKIKTYQKINNIFMLLLPDKSNSYLSNNKLKKILRPVLFQNLLSIKSIYSYPECFLSIYGDGMQRIVYKINLLKQEVINYPFTPSINKDFPIKTYFLTIGKKNSKLRKNEIELQPNKGIEDLNAIIYLYKKSYLLSNLSSKSSIKFKIFTSSKNQIKIYNDMYNQGIDIEFGMILTIHLDYNGEYFDILIFSKQFIGEISIESLDEFNLQDLIDLLKNRSGMGNEILKDLENKENFDFTMSVCLNKSYLKISLTEASYISVWSTLPRIPSKSPFHPTPSIDLSTHNFFKINSINFWFGLMQNSNIHNN